MSDLFDANNWVKHKNSISNNVLPLGAGPLTSSVSKAYDSQNLQSPFNPVNFVLPGWSGNSLPSKNGIALQKLVSNLKKEAEKQFLKGRFNRSIEEYVFNEFLRFAHENSIDFSGIDTYQELYQYLKNDSNSKYGESLSIFKNKFFHQVVVVYLLKIRFMVKLATSQDMPLSTIDLRNPNSFFIQIFKPRSSLEIDSIALKKNNYSWFQPLSFAGQNKSLLSEVINIFNTLPITEIYKVFKINDLFSKHETEYSHSLSHESFGNFVIQLLTIIPEWLQSNKPLKTLNIANLLNNKSEIPLKTLFTGDNLESMSLSHWLAQEKISLKDKKYIIHPDFKESNSRASYNSICFELIFLSLLTEIANRSERDSVELIASSYKKCKTTTETKSMSSQASLFDTAGLNIHQTVSNYDRIVLNLVKFPKKNPHHFLLGKIHDTAEKLSDDGYLYVMSMQKLFLPSMASKIEDFLKVYRLETVFTFEKLKGKGELPSYLYVISKRSKREQKTLNLPSELVKGNPQDIFSATSPWDQESANKDKKYPCLSFRVNGNLSNFSKFNVVIKAMKDFVLNKNHSTTSMFERELDDNFNFEFYQDTICNGRLLYTSSKDRSKITHPSYMKNLMRSCIPLGSFFQIESLDNKDFESDTLKNDLLGIRFSIEENFPWVLIVDYRNKNNTKIEFINSEHYKSKLEKNGKALCSYFGISPKIRGININQFQHFYKSEIGHQIIQLGINGGFNKLKSKLAALLVPKFFENIHSLPENLNQTLSFFNKTNEDIMNSNFKALIQDLEDITPFLANLSKKHPWHLYSYLLHFSGNLSQVISQFSRNTKKMNKGSFSSEQLISEISKLSCTSIYPGNDDVYIKFHISESNLLNLSLTDLKTSSVEKSGKDISGVSLCNENREILTFYSKSTMVQFLNFIFAHYKNYPITQILQYTKIPSLKDLEKTIEDFNCKESDLKELQTRVNNLSKSLIRSQLGVSNFSHH